MALISIRPWSGLIDFERFTVFHTSTSGGGLDFIYFYLCALGASARYIFFLDKIKRFCNRVVQRTQSMPDSLTEKIISAAIEVHKILGPGLLESIY